MTIKNADNTGCLTNTSLKRSGQTSPFMVQKSSLEDYNKTIQTFPDLLTPKAHHQDNEVKQNIFFEFPPVLSDMAKEN